MARAQPAPPNSGVDTSDTWTGWVFTRATGAGVPRSTSTSVAACTASASTPMRSVVGPVDVALKDSSYWLLIDAAISSYSPLTPAASDADTTRPPADAASWS